jgi:hypothetical protein
MRGQGYCQVDEVSTNIGSSSAMMTTAKSIDRGDWFPADVIEQSVWLSIRFPLSLRMAARSQRVADNALVAADLHLDF